MGEGQRERDRSTLLAEQGAGLGAGGSSGTHPRTLGS